MMAHASHSTRSPANSQAPLILHVVHRFDVGGLENGVVNLVNRMSETRWRHAILALTEVSQTFARRIEREGVQLLSLHKGPGHLLRLYPRLYRIFKELQPAIVHTRNLAALEACVPAWAAGVPVRVHGEHGWDVSDPHGAVRKYRMVRRAYRPFVHRYIALSQHIRDYLEQGVGIGASAISQIYNGVDITRFQWGQDQRLRAEGCPFTGPDHWIVGTVGRLEAVKDQLNLVHAFARALELDPAARQRMRLMIVGDGSMHERVKEQIARYGLTQRVWMPGARSDVPALLRTLDCFVLPSLSEGISNTILEAMASSLPVIATRVGGNSELIEDGLSGRLVPAANSEALAQAMVSYLQDSRTARRHARTARRLVEDRFSLDRMVADYSDVYDGLLRRAGVAIARAPVPLVQTARNEDKLSNEETRCVE